MKAYLLTEEKLAEIRSLLQNHQVRIAKIELGKLEEFQEDKLREELRRYLMNQGKSDISKKEIWGILDKTKLNLTKKEE